MHLQAPELHRLVCCDGHAVNLHDALDALIVARERQERVGGSGEDSLAGLRGLLHYLQDDVSASVACDARALLGIAEHVRRKRNTCPQ